ncbi:iron-containing redox enzyme family protein [Hyalangium sp.]|uniref:TenA family transcriptional regulator n=1 Tax=Hyalangium sp. TaxID=2028555 RepID=UPI002D25F56A|nr:iron-containing redox enzyme family protein [Hyalangium sp.]HYH99067.1 iron-containing redox enzyme family protein [Hyalangium sp.]
MRDSLQRLKARVAPLESPYLRALSDGSFEQEDFVETQIQFLHAVVYFSRPIAVLAARLPSAEQRLSLLENVHDEHGGGDLSGSHERTFLTLLARLGVSIPEIDRRAQWPEVRAFNSTLLGVCAHDDVPTALAMLGVIEELFSGISARMGRSIVERGWLREEELTHYPTHEVLDLSHAEGFYRWIEPLTSADPRAAYQVEQGLELGAYIFLRLYEDLFRARKRRVSRVISGPHSLADGWALPRGSE